MHSHPILIIGKNGKTGSRVNQLLQGLGYSTRAVSRSSTPSFDWEDQSTWQAVLEGTRSAYITFQPDLAIPSARQTIQEFVDLAKELGLKHLVLLSGRGEDGAKKAEQVLQNSGLTWNIIRASWFAQNFSESFMLEGIISGHLALPAGDIVEPFVDVDDIAEVTVAALTRPELNNRLFEVTGPRAITFADCVREISNAAGYPIKYTTIPIDTFIGSLAEQGIPEEMQWLLRELFTEVLDGRNSQVMTGIEEALGRPANDFRDYIHKVNFTGNWIRD